MPYLRPVLVLGLVMVGTHQVDPVSKCVVCHVRFHKGVVGERWRSDLFRYWSSNLLHFHHMSVRAGELACDKLAVDGGHC